MQFNAIMCGAALHETMTKDENNGGDMFYHRVRVTSGTVASRNAPVQLRERWPRAVRRVSSMARGR